MAIVDALWGPKCGVCGRRAKQQMADVGNETAKICAPCALRALSTADTVPFLVLDELLTLIHIAGGSDPRLAETARMIAGRLRARMPSGPDACPRCGGSNATEGNATGWRCNGCGLKYRAHGNRDPLKFGASGGFRGGPPWRHEEFADLLSQVAGARQEDSNWWRNTTVRAADLLTVRRSLLASLE